MCLLIQPTILKDELKITAINELCMGGLYSNHVTQSLGSMSVNNNAVLSNSGGVVK